MATVTGYTAAKMQQFADASVVSGTVVGTNLHLTTQGGTVIDAGNVQGPQGNTGPQGIQGIPGGTSAQRDAFFGVPTVLADQVTLANKAPLWYNVTSGLLEAYYVPSGSAGLTVPGFYSAPGWYQRDVATRRPLGTVALVEMTSAGGTTSTQQIVMNIASFTFKANRRYEIEWTMGAVGITAGTTGLAQLFSCSTADGAQAITGLTELTGFNLDWRQASQTSRIVAKRKIMFTVDTTLQIKASLNGNGNSCYCSAGATWPGQLSIEDKGMQF